MPTDCLLLEEAGQEFFKKTCEELRSGKASQFLRYVNSKVVEVEK